MKKTDITREIRQMHEEKLMQRAIKEVKSELQAGIPANLQQELDQLLARSNAPGSRQANNIVSFSTRPASTKVYTFGETELLAAAGQSLADWFSQPMSFGGAGFNLDVRKVIGTEDEVDVYLSPNKSSPEEMRKSLSTYIGKSIQIKVTNNRDTLLDAVLYIDEAGSAAEGSGKLIVQPMEATIKGKIEISIVVENDSSPEKL